MTLKDKIVLITGSSRGIGKAIAEHFAHEGSIVIINSRTDTNNASELVGQLSKLTTADYFQADVSKPEEARKLIDTVIEKYHRIDVLINNAGNGHEAEFLDLQESDITTSLQENLVSTILCSQQAIKKTLENNGKLKIINTGSVRGWEFGGNAPIYGAAKAAVHNLTNTLARKYAPNILVNAVAPGVTKTPAYDAVPQEKIDMFLGQSKIKRWITADEVAAAYIFLAKNDAITGETLYIDGGFRLK